METLTFNAARAGPTFLYEESYDPTSLPKTSSKEQLILLAISDRQVYGLEIQNHIERSTNGREKLSLGSLYPLLHSLDKKKLVQSKWGEENTCGARRKYYSLTKKGEDIIRDIFTTQTRLLCDDLPENLGDE